RDIFSRMIFPSDRLPSFLFPRTLLKNLLKILQFISINGLDAREDDPPQLVDQLGWVGIRAPDCAPISSLEHIRGHDGMKCPVEYRRRKWRNAGWLDLGIQAFMIAAEF